MILWFSLSGLIDRGSTSDRTYGALPSALPEDVVIKMVNKRKREAEAETLETRKKCRQERKKEKKVARIAHTALGRIITPSNDTKDMISTASGGMEILGLVSCPSHYGDVVASSNVPA